jgi:hypothetical protein
MFGPTKHKAHVFNKKKVRRPFLPMPPKLRRNLDTRTNRAPGQKLTGLFGHVISAALQINTLKKMNEQPDTFALAYVLKFRHTLAVTHPHAMTAAAITINALYQHTLKFEPDSPRRTFYRQALEHLERLYEQHQEKEMDQLKKQ